MTDCLHKQVPNATGYLSDSILTTMGECDNCGSESISLRPTFIDDSENKTIKQLLCPTCRKVQTGDNLDQLMENVGNLYSAD